MAREFTVMVERDPESGWLVGDVKELPGCLTEAPDMPTLQSNMREAIIGYLIVAEPTGDELAILVEWGTLPVPLGYRDPVARP